jgi:hypothetical protein
LHYSKTYQLQKDHPALGISKHVPLTTMLSSIVQASTPTTPQVSVSKAAKTDSSLNIPGQTAEPFKSSKILPLPPAFTLNVELINKSKIPPHIADSAESNTAEVAPAVQEQSVDRAEVLATPNQITIYTAKDRHDDILLTTVQELTVASNGGEKCYQCPSPQRLNSLRLESVNEVPPNFEHTYGSSTDPSTQSQPTNTTRTDAMDFVHFNEERRSELSIQLRTPSPMVEPGLSNDAYAERMKIDSVYETPEASDKDETFDFKRNATQIQDDWRRPSDADESDTAMVTSDHEFEEAGQNHTTTPFSNLT